MPLLWPPRPDTGTVAMMSEMMPKQQLRAIWDQMVRSWSLLETVQVEEAMLNLATGTMTFEFLPLTQMVGPLFERVCDLRRIIPMVPLAWCLADSLAHRQWHLNA